MKPYVLLLMCVLSSIASPSWGAGLVPSTTIFGPTTVIDKQNEASLASVLENSNKHGGTIVLNPDVKKGALPVRPNHKTRVIDLRYGEGVSLIRGNHPRLEGFWPQYSGLNTGLRKNMVISDVVPYDAQVENWRGEVTQTNPENKHVRQTSEEFANTHNHYQNLLSEVWGFSPSVNTVAFWGDSGAFYPGVKSWGGFLSARSWPVHWQEYVPAGTPEFKDEDFDASLVGLEVDVLNAGLPQGSVSKLVGIPLSKIGVQLVGFGKTNTAALELRSEDSDDLAKSPNERRGTWHYGIIEHSAMNGDSTLLISTTSAAKTGIDFSRTQYSDAAIKLNSNGEKTGIAFNNYLGGELYARGDSMFMRIGPGGLSIVSPEGNEIAHIDKEGDVKWQGINITSPTLYRIPFLMFVVLLAMVIIMVKTGRELRAASVQLEKVRASMAVQMNSSASASDGGASPTIL